MKFYFAAALACLAATPVAAFAPRPALTLRTSAAQAPLSQPSVSDRSAVAVSATKRENEFHWNMNENRPPWGFAENAEIWNGRVSMMSFFYLAFQEAIFGPVLKPDQPFGSVVMSGAFVVGLAATSALFWFNQENDPVKDMTIDNIEEYM